MNTNEVAQSVNQQLGWWNLSCGAFGAVVLRLAMDFQYKGKTIVVVLPDSGERYLNTALFEGLFDPADVPL